MSGALGAGERVVSLDARGPAFDGPAGTMAQYRDQIENVGPDERHLHGNGPHADGRWQRLMTARVRREGWARAGDGARRTRAT